MIWLSMYEAHHIKFSDNLSTPCINFSSSSYMLAIPAFDIITRSSDPFDPQQNVFWSLSFRFSSSVKFSILFSNYLCNEVLYYKQTSHRAVILWSFGAFFLWNKLCHSCHQPILYFIFFLRLLKSATQYVCVTVSRLSQKFDICSLLGAFKLGYCFRAIVTFFRSWIPCHTKIFLELVLIHQASSLFFIFFPHISFKSSLFVLWLVHFSHMCFSHMYF